MITYLRVKNLALIESVEVEFGPGLNVFTGETGAGKSILLGAVTLLLGGRASEVDIRTGEQSAYLEGVFDISHIRNVQLRLTKYGIPVEEGDLFVRREIHHHGRNRIFLNATPCPLSVLVDIGDMLVDVHGQHQHQSLLRPESHLEIVDSFKEVEPVRKKYTTVFETWSKAVSEYHKLIKKEKEYKERRDMIAYRAQEISEAGVDIDEDKKLERELEKLESSEKRLELSSRISQSLSESHTSALNILRECARNARTLAKLDQEMEEQAALLDNAFVEINEAARGYAEYSSRIDYTPERIEEINERLSVLSRLKKKYGGSLEDVLSIFDEAEKELQRINDIGREKEEAYEQCRIALSRLAEHAEELSKMRKKIIKNLNRQITKSLKELGMESGRFEVSVTSRESADGVEIKGRKIVFDFTGTDKIEMMISPNQGEPLRPLAKIASGGEISRVMLAIKSFIAESDRVSTLIFDEIDSGIGGLVAKRVAGALEKLSSTHQILCVTHLPLIAAKAHNHFVVDKKIEKGRTRTIISKIESQERIEEIARMMGDRKDATMQHARDLING